MKPSYRPDTPILCRVCPVCKPLWHRIKGTPLPGGRCKCISLSGICEAIKKILARFREETGQGSTERRRAN